MTLKKGVLLFCFLFALYKNFQELERPKCYPIATPQNPTEGLSLGSVFRSLRHPGFMGINLYTKKVCIL